MLTGRVFALIDPWLRDPTVMLALADTLARKRELKVYGVGLHHDPMISTRKVPTSTELKPTGFAHDSG